MGTSTSGIAEGEAALAAAAAAPAPGRKLRLSPAGTGQPGEFTARSLGLTGPAYTIATACASSAKVFASARRLIRAGLADAAVVGGADTLVPHDAERLRVAARRCRRGAATRSAATATASPSARAPPPSCSTRHGSGGIARHRRDLRRASPRAPPGRGGRRGGHAAGPGRGRAGASEIGYVNLHGTATPLNDAMESRAVAGVFGGRVPCSSTKPLTGHMLGASGGLRGRHSCGCCWRARTTAARCRRICGMACPIRTCPAASGPGRRTIAFAGRAVLSNTFGFAGSNVAMLLGRPHEGVRG